MVVDYKNFYKNQPILPQADILTIIEIIPGTFETQNVSYTHLAMGFWASYNRPYFSTIFMLSGYPYLDIFDKNSNSWSLDTRAILFRYWNGKIFDYKDMLTAFRNNNPKDRYQQGSSQKALMSRHDIIISNNGEQYLP